MSGHIACVKRVQALMTICNKHLSFVDSHEYRIDFLGSNNYAVRIKCACLPTLV